MSFEVIIDQVRSFASRNQVPIRPLTLLVGENSSGKSTFLACIAAAHGLRSGFSLPEFNTPPYNLGTYETIATYKGGRSGRAKQFAIGIGEQPKDAKRDDGLLTSIATFDNHKGNPRLKRIEVRTQSFAIVIEPHDDDLTVAISIIETDGRKSSATGEIPRIWMRLEQSPRFLIRSVFMHVERNRDGHYKNSRPDSLPRLLSPDLMGRIDDAFYGRPIRHCASLSPIRSKPRRTYDTLLESFDSEGDHVPTTLSRLLQAEAIREAKSLRDSLHEFGESSGLFGSLRVKRLGKGIADPFQIQVNVGGRDFNLSDIGYGVSQVLPVIVESILRREAAVLLIQQPEVHLHPRAQAALGTFFTQVADGNRTFVIETHSDYLVDRVRQEVAKGTIKSEDVQILFFDKPDLETKIHQLTIDENGNVENAPDEYCSFFMEESINLLTRTSG